MYMAQIKETFSMFQGMCVSQQERLRPIKQMKAKADKTAVQEEHSPIGSGSVNTATMEISVSLPQEPEDSSVSTSSITTVGNIPKGLSILQQRHLLNCCCSIHNFEI